MTIGIPDNPILLEATHMDETSLQAARTTRPLWRAFGASTVGATHIQRGIPNQDAVHWYPADDGLNKTGLPSIIAVSDGHGETACVRSHLGARFAVEIAVATLREFACDDQFRGCSGLTDLKQYAPRLLSGRISEQWTTRVLEHSQEIPFTFDELSRIQGCGELSLEGLESKKLRKAYGCTLLAALVTPSFLIGLQVGDGSLVVAYSDGRSHLLIPPHEAHFGNDTTSLCSVPVPMQVEVRPLEGDAPVVVMACTDGYDKAFDPSYFQAELLSEYVACLRAHHGWREVYKDLPAILEDATAKGSGDDASVAFLVSAVLEENRVIEVAEKNDLPAVVSDCTSTEQLHSTRTLAEEIECTSSANSDSSVATKSEVDEATTPPPA